MADGINKNDERSGDHLGGSSNEQFKASMAICAQCFHHYIEPNSSTPDWWYNHKCLEPSVQYPPVEHPKKQRVVETYYAYEGDENVLTDDPSPPCCDVNMSGKCGLFLSKTAPSLDIG